MATMKFAPLQLRDALKMITWRYAPPYDCYDMTDADPSVLSDPASGFFSLSDDTDALIGYRSFGADGQVPGGMYDDSALDTGGGLRPDLTGKGLGRRAIEAGLSFGLTLFAPDAFRVTVASFNIRALRVVQSLGFRQIDHFAASTDGRHYEILTRAARGPTVQ